MPDAPGGRHQHQDVLCPLYNFQADILEGAHFCLMKKVWKVIAWPL